MTGEGKTNDSWDFVKNPNYFPVSTDPFKRWQISFPKEERTVFGIGNIGAANDREFH